MDYIKHTSLAYNTRMVIIETSVFTRLIRELMDDDNYRELQEALVQQPDAGDLIKGSGGLRKVRWKLEGRGKRGGVRIIYYFKKQDDEIWLLTIYSKNEVENIPAHILRQIAKEIENV